MCGLVFLFLISTVESFDVRSKGINERSGDSMLTGIEGVDILLSEDIAIEFPVL